MSLSSEFHEHTRILYDNLQRLLGGLAVEVVPGQFVGAGLLSHKGTQTNSPRLIVASGMAALVEQAFDEIVDDDLLVAGVTSDGDATIGHICVTCPGVAKAIPGGGNLAVEAVEAFCDWARVAEPEAIGAGQAATLYTTIHGNLLRR